MVLDPDRHTDENTYYIPWCYLCMWNRENTLGKYCNRKLCRQGTFLEYLCEILMEFHEFRSLRDECWLHQTLRQHSPFTMPYMWFITALGSRFTDLQSPAARRQTFNVTLFWCGDYYLRRKVSTLLWDTFFLWSRSNSFSTEIILK
jgi:hypothetical protein